jgi:RHS repeat-associated protein
MYEHGGSIDAPLGVVRMEYSSELYDAQVIVPHNDWRGTYDRGTTVVGSCLVYSTNGTQLAPPPDSTPSSGDQYGGVVGGGTYSGTKEHCIDVDWPAAYTWSARQYRRGYSGPDSWMGSLIFESRDASGLYYRRNRYYDSEKGRFTQEDPIGLAGGVNVYGFAGGDPVSFDDPYGLCRPYPQCIPEELAALGKATWHGMVNFTAGFSENLIGRQPGTPPVDRRSFAYVSGMIAGQVVQGKWYGPVDPEILNTAGRIQHNQPKYRQDGTVFQNRERRLPQQSDPNYYREWTVDTPGATGRGARRIVVGKQGEMYYTGDHYRTFYDMTPEH